MGSIVDLNDEEIEELIILSIATNPWAQLDRPSLDNANTNGMHTDVYTTIVVRLKANEYHHRQMGDIATAVLNSPGGKTALAMPSLKDDDRLQFLQVADYMYRQGYRLVTADEYRRDVSIALDGGGGGSTPITPFWRPIRTALSMHQPIRLPVIQSYPQAQAQAQHHHQSQYHHHAVAHPSHQSHHHPSHYHPADYQAEYQAEYLAHNHPHQSQPPLPSAAASHVIVPFTHKITSHPLTRTTIRPPPGIQHSFYGVGAFASAELLSLPTSVSLALATTQEGFYSPNGSPRRGGFTSPCPCPQGYIYNDPAAPLLYDPHGGFLHSQPPPQVNHYPYDPYSYGDRYGDIAEYGETKESDLHRQYHSNHQSNRQSNHRAMQPFTNNHDHGHNNSAAGGGGGGGGGRGIYSNGSGRQGEQGGKGGDGDEDDGGEGVVMMMRKRVKPRGPSAVATAEQAVGMEREGGERGNGNGDNGFVGRDEREGGGGGVQIMWVDHDNQSQYHHNHHNNIDEEEDEDEDDGRHRPHHTFTASSTATTHPWPMAPPYSHHTTHPYSHHTVMGHDAVVRMED